VPTPTVPAPDRIPTHEEWRKVYKGSNPRKKNLDRKPTAKELREANKELKLGEETQQGVRQLRKDILEGRVNATKQRKRELGLMPEVRVTIPAKEHKLKTKFTKEQFEKYLETARRLDEQKRKRLAEAINDVMKETGQ
jgi:hypothetical protein